MLDRELKRFKDSHIVLAAVIVLGEARCGSALSVLVRLLLLRWLLLDPSMAKGYAEPRTARGANARNPMVPGMHASMLGWAATPKRRAGAWPISLPVVSAVALALYAAYFPGAPLCTRRSVGQEYTAPSNAKTTRSANFARHENL